MKKYFICEESYICEERIKSEQPCTIVSQGCIVDEPKICPFDKERDAKWIEISETT